MREHSIEHSVYAHVYLNDFYICYICEYIDVKLIKTPKSTFQKLWYTYVAFINKSCRLIRSSAFENTHAFYEENAMVSTSYFRNLVEETLVLNIEYDSDQPISTDYGNSKFNSTIDFRIHYTLEVSQRS